MAAAANIILTDAESTPVNRAFIPARVTGDFAQYEYRDADQYIGYDKLSLQLVRPSGPIVEGTNRNLKLHVKLETPLMKTLSTGTTSTGYTAAPAVDYRLVAEVKLTCPEQCSLQDRMNLHAMIVDALGEAAVGALVYNYEMPY